MFGLIEIILLIGAFHGSFLGSILAFKRTGDHAANRLFAALLLITSWQLLLAALAKSGVLVQVPYLAGTAYPFMFLLGPIYYFYAKKLTTGAFGFRVYDVLHLIPFLYVVWWLTPYYLMDSGTKAEVLAAQHASSDASLSTGILVSVLCNLLLAVAYFYFAHRMIARKENALRDMTSDTATVVKISRLRFLTKGYALYLVGLACTILLLAIFDTYNETIDTSWILTKSLFIHAIGYAAIVQPAHFWGTGGNRADDGGSANGPRGEEPKYQKSGLTEEQASLYHGRLVQLMESRQPYLDSDLTLDHLAELLSISPNHLSQVINQQTGLSFYDFVNEYRVEQAKQVLLDDDVGYTVLGVALEAGFNSKSTFYRVFKKHTQTTPTAFKRQRRTVSMGEAVGETGASLAE